MMDINPLNEDQKEAIFHKNGPLLIIAGAGTGKTKVITSRIVHLLLNQHVPSSAILALTFTEKAALEMLSRVDQAMPLGYEEIEITTFHSFCDRVLKEHGLDIGLNTNYRLLDEVDLWMLLKKNLFRFDLTYYRPLGNPDQFLTAFIKYISRLKDQDIDPETFLEYARNVDQQFSDHIQKKQEKILELAHLYREYQNLLQENNVLDFGDLHFYTLHLFKKRQEALASYQKRYAYILVDEFQDTNFAQNKLLTLLCDKSSNITVVGDDDQSIYKFRGASVSNILNFEKFFPATKKIVLTKNYRSNQAILDLSYSVIQHNNPDRLEYTEKIDKRLTAIASENANGSIRVLHFEHYLEELRFISNEIVTLIHGGFLPSDIAILVRTNTQARPFFEELEHFGIECDYINREPIFAREEVKDLIALLRFLADPQDNIALFRLLQSEIFSFEMEDILSLVHETRSLNISLFQSLKKSQETSSLFNDFSKKSHDAVHFLQKLIEHSRRKRVSEIVGNFLYKETHYLQDLEKKGSLYDRHIQLIADFSHLVASFETHYPEYGLKDFVEYLKILEEGGQMTTYDTVRSSQAGVKILTVHSSKGLEFDTVFIPCLVQHKFPSIRRSESLEIPQELIRETLPQGDVHIQEERRLFYVACTRAKRHLYMTFSSLYEGKKIFRCSQFVQEALKSGKISVEESLERQHSPESKLLVTSLYHDANNKPLPGTRSQDFISYTPRQLSYSQLDAFHRCPYKYKFKYIFKLPSPVLHRESFGTSIHSTLNEFYHCLKRGEKPSKELLQQLYENHWISLGYHNKSHELIRKKSGWEALERFYIHNSSAWTIPAFLEKPFTMRIGTISFSGRIDRIDRLNDGTFEVIDYKTGKLKTKKATFKDMQLSVYALACKKIFNLPVSRLSLYFIESDEKISTTRSEQELEEFEKTLTEEIHVLLNSDYKPTPGMVCKSCEYRLLCFAAKY